MTIWKTSKRLLAMVMVLALLLPNVLIPGVFAVDNAVLVPPTDIGRVVFANSAATGKGDGSSPENAFTSLESAFTALDDASGDAVIVVCGTVYVSGSWNVDGLTHAHSGVYYITGKYGTYDYSASAVIEYNNTTRADLNYNGATHYSNITLKSADKANVMFYSAQGFEWGSGVTTVNYKRFSVYGGLTHAHLIGVEAPYIKISSGQLQTIMATGDKPSGDTTPGLEYYGLGGVMHITIGGTARVESNISTGYKALSGGVVLTMNGGYVKEIYASGRAGTWINGNLTVNLNAGEIGKFGDKSDATNVKISGNITVNLKSDCQLGSGTFTAWGSNTTCTGTKTLNLNGYVGTVAADTFASYNTVNVIGNSNATYASSVPSTTAIVVGSGSTLNLPAHADGTGLNITNNGTVNFSSGSDEATIPVVFVGDVAHANYAKLPEGATVYSSLSAAYQGLAGDGETDAYIILFSSTPVGSSFNTDNTKPGWSGTYYVTGKYSSGDVSYDFGSDAVIELTPTSGKNFSPAGKQHFSNMKFYHTGTANINFYSSKGITIESTVTYEQAEGAGTMSIYGGEYAAAITNTVINVYGGEFYSVRSGNSNSTVTNATINIGGNAKITNCIVAGGNKAVSPVTKAVINIEGGQIYQIYNSGLGCAMDSLTINWTGGSTTLGLTAHASSASTVNAMKLKLSSAVAFAEGAVIQFPTMPEGTLPKLELTDYTGDMPVSASSVEKTTLSGSSNVNYNGREAATFIVNAGTTLNVTGYTQAEAASVLSITNNGGTVTYSGVAAVYPTVVYVDGKGSGNKNGLTADNAVATLQAALALLNPAEGGTVVLCGELKIASTTKFSDCGIIGQVTLTSVYEGIDYRTSGAKLTWNSNKVKFGGTGNMVLDALVLHMESVDEGSTVAANVSQYLYSSAYMHITESVTVTGKGRLKMFIADIGANADLDCEALLEGGEFYQVFVGGNTNPTGNATLTIDKNASVSSNVAMGGNSSNVVNGNSVLNMKGGYVKVIYDISNGGTVTGDVVLNLTGGSITEMRDYNNATGIVINGDVIVTVGSGFDTGSAAFGAWASSAVTVGGKKILNLTDYSGAGLSSLNVYDVVNVFGGTIPEGFDISVDATGKLLRVHDFNGIMGLDLTDFAKIKLTGAGSHMTFQGKVPTGSAGNPTALIVDDGCTMLIRASVNPGVTLANYAITKLNGGTGEVIMAEAEYVGSADLILDVNFDDGTAADASGKGNNGVITGSPDFVEGIDGGKAIYIHNAFGKNAATQYVTFSDLNGVDVSKANYTVSFWYHTINGGTTQWANSSEKTTAGANINMGDVKVGGVVLSNQNVASDGSGFSAVQLSHNQFFAAGVTSENGNHYDKDGIRSIVDDTWHMVTISYDRNGYYTIYVDGQQTAKKSISGLKTHTLGINTLVLGADVKGKYGLENAYIDNLRVFSGAMNAIDVMAYYMVDCTNMLVNDAQNSVEELGSAYDSYKGAMTQTINTVKQAMETVTVNNYADAVNAYVMLKSDYESFLAAPQEDALLSALLLSDIHISKVGDTNAQRFEAVFKDLSQMGIKPDVFINGGDFSDDSSAGAYNAAFDVYEMLKEKYDLDMPMFLSQGNHELAYENSNSNYSVTSPIYAQRMMENLESYIAAGKVTVDYENYDPTNIKVSYGYKNYDGQVVTHNANRGYSYGMTFVGEDGKPSYHFVMLNTDNIEQTGRSKDDVKDDGSYSSAGNFKEAFRHGSKFLDETLDWLDMVMEDYGADGLPIFFMNHAPFRDTCALSTYSTTVIDDNTIGMQDMEVRAILAKYENVFTFSGHLHHNLGIASIMDVVDPASGNTFTQVNLPGIKGAARAYSNIPAGWLMFVYADEVVFRARDYTTGEWLTEFDVVVKLTASEEEKPLLGDANNDGLVNSNDADLLKQYRAGLIDASELNLEVCDLDGNEKVDAYDAYLIQLRLAGAIDKFPAENTT